MRVRRGRLLTALLVLAFVGALGWYESVPQVASGQRPLQTLDAGSLAGLRDEFNRDTSQVRIIVLLSPT